MIDSSAQIDRSRSWDDEYTGQGIPSSWKQDPSTVVLWGLHNLSWLSVDVSPEDTVMDIGCGTGRNSVAVADRLGCTVIGFDYSQGAVDKARQRRNSLPPDLKERVTFARHDMRDPLLAADQSIRLAMDIFVYFHLLDRDDRSRYRAELARVLHPNGVLMLSLAPADDGYYAGCPEQPDWRDRSGVPVVLDEHAGVGNVMHTLPSLETELSDTFELAMTWTKRVEGPMHGNSYERVTLATLWRLKGDLR